MIGYKTLPEIYRFKTETTFGRLVIPRLITECTAAVATTTTVYMFNGGGYDGRGGGGNTRGVQLQNFTLAFSLLATKNK